MRVMLPTCKVPSPHTSLNVRLKSVRIPARARRAYLGRSSGLQLNRLTSTPGGVVKHGEGRPRIRLGGPRVRTCLADDHRDRAFETEGEASRKADTGSWFGNSAVGIQVQFR